jgi:predicted transcriptional regulator
VPIAPAPVQVRTLSDADLEDPRLTSRLRDVLRDAPTGLLAAYGLEAFHALRRATERPIGRFAAAAEAQDASRLGVASTVIVLESELPRFLAEFGGTNPPPLNVTPLPRGRGR